MVQNKVKAQASLKLKILCVHGAGKHPVGGPWEGEWQKAIVESLRTLDDKVIPIIHFVYLDDIFDKHPISPLDVLDAIAKLVKSGVASLFKQPKGLGDDIRWTAGMIVQWVENKALRDETRRRLEAEMKKFKPDIVCSHSLGSLVCYDSFTGTGANLIKGRRFISCGSQIGNPFVVGNFAAGRLTGLSQAKFWYHLFNDKDTVFTAAIRLSEPNFTQVETLFNIQGVLDHDVTEYMRHGRTAEVVWSDAIMALRKNPIERELPSAVSAGRKASTKWIVKPKKRALLVGINEYKNPGQNLEGCVNDVFLMSALLQESGFAAEDIRIVLNDRATHSGVSERLEWLLEDAKAGDIRFFYYSGHGAQLPSYGIGDQIDRLDETLVLHDFDWTRERAFTDDDFYELYSQLPYDLNFLSVFDCCHSGGMTRASVSKVRGINPPDDIRHRALRWDPEHEMWIEREIESPNKGFENKFNSEKTTKDVQRFTHRLGQAMDLRAYSPAAAKAKTAARGHKGPYLPVLIYASREEEYSFEYRHGPISYGAFTYSLVKTLRRDRRLKNPRLTFNSLIVEVRKELAELGYEQQPALIAPTAIKKHKVPLSVG